MNKDKITYDDIKAQDQELGEQSAGKFLKESKGPLTFWDGYKWQSVQSKKHLEQLSKGLEIYLDKQLEHIEYTLALTMSKRRGELFEVYQRAVTAISARIREQTIEYRKITTERVNKAALAFFEDEDAFNEQIKNSNLPDERKKDLMERNSTVSNANVSAIYSEMATELENYNKMCVNIYVGMTDEIEEHRIIDITQN